jgi:hypothetical protein
MTSEQPLFDHRHVRHLSPSDPSQTTGGLNPQEGAAPWLAALIIAIENNLLVSIARANERLERAHAIMSVSTELIATSHETLARSRDILAGRQYRYEQASKKRRNLAIVSGSAGQATAGHRSWAASIPSTGLRFRCSGPN